MLMKKASLVGAFFMSAIWLSAAQAFCPAPSGLTPVAVQRVVDGDTLRLSDGRSVRMIGLNTPELGKKGRSDEPFAVAARRRLEALVAASDGRVGLLPGKEGKDHYGRTLAHVYGADGANLEAQMLAEGLGFQVAVAPNVDLVACQQAAERSARQAGLGIWRQSPVLKAEQINASGFAVLSGRVSKVQRNRGGVWIELQDAVVLRVAPNLLGSFDAAALERLQGKQIEARGWVLDRSRRGGLKEGQPRWMLPLTDPAMLQVAQ
ncbi:thermonuclease family protein [Pseudomonas vancouverensis]|uniref:Thermonuclease family protein n=1 Tax=Pseudomonas vancouverensis TaxID=95300 RepID=A0A1H2PBI0_PSEVA|nr:thermonuclease family protein [Pseudomonas vancouverensis]KAB0493833.1 thermonuclease family protein [Pseudomonas vancouverensis]TDB58027.1 thermonuclease family protein [Pseudomonas vancouverensis]SDV15069.1 Endonuclease YncB, thermonuclease family [Pseudomonas vancouverensis]